MKLASQQVPPAVAQSDSMSLESAEALNRISASGAYLHATLSSDYTPVLIVADPVTYDTADELRGDLTLDGSGRVSGLKAGRTYQIDWGAHAFDGRVGTILHDVTGAVQLGKIAYNTDLGPDASSGAYVFTPSVDTQIEVRIDNFDNSGRDILAGSSFFRVIEIGATVVSAVSGLEYMDRITVGSPVSSVTFGAAGDGIESRALDGDVDGVYELQVYWPKPVLTLHNLEIFPNGVDPVSTATWDRLLYGSVVTSSGFGWAIAVLGTVGSGTGAEVSGLARIQARTGQKRTLEFIGTSSTIGGSDLAGALQTSSTWHEDSTNITSLEIINPSADLPAGTELVLYRRVETPFRADSADTYERRVESAVTIGTATTEQTAGHTVYAGDVVGLSVRIEEPVTAGTVVVNLKVDGVTTLSVTLDTTNTISQRVVVPIGTHPFGIDENVSAEVIATSYDNVGSITSGLTVVGTFVNQGLATTGADFKAQQNVYTKAQVVAPSPLVYGANMAVDASLSNVFTVTLTGATAEIDNPTNLAAGQTMVFQITQDGTGGRALTFGTTFQFGAEGAPDLTAEIASAVSLISCISDGTRLFSTALLGFTIL
jgi:hypothetical protein